MHVLINCYIQVLRNCYIQVLLKSCIPMLLNSYIKVFLKCFIQTLQIIYMYYLHAIYTYIDVLSYEADECTSAIIWIVIYIEILSHVRQLLLYINSTLTLNFMNFVAMSFHNISKALDFKPDDNCVSTCGQTRRGRLVSTSLLWQLEFRPGELG
jgi:hypothetical protein